MTTSDPGRAGMAAAIEGTSPGGANPRLGSDAGGTLVVALVALLVGGLVNAFRAQPLPWWYQGREQIMKAAVADLQGDDNAPIAADGISEPTHEIRLDDFQPFVAEHRGLVIDARASVFYREAHVPGALNLSREDFSKDYPTLRGQLEAHKDGPIAVYCSGADCPDAQLVADALTKLGYRRLVIYTSGWDEWSRTGLPQEGPAAMP